MYFIPMLLFCCKAVLGMCMDDERLEKPNRPENNRKQVIKFGIYVKGKVKMGCFDRGLDRDTLTIMI